MRSTLIRFYLFRSLGLTWLYVPFQWFYLRERGLSATELMALNALFCVTAVLLEVPTGALADRLGRRPVLVSGALASALSCVAFVTMSSTMVGLALANVLAAVAMTCISGADSAYLFDLLREKASSLRYQRAESISSAVRLGAASLGGLAGFAMVARGADLALLYVVTAVLTTLAALIALGLPEAPRSGGHESPRHLVSEIFRHGRRAGGLVLRRQGLLMLLGVSALLFPVLRVGLFFDQPFLRRIGFATAAVGLVFAAKDLVAAFAAAFTARLLSVLGERRLMVALPVVAGLGALAMAFASRPEAAILVLVPTAAFGVYSPLIRVFVNSRVDKSGDRATVLSIEGMARRIGFALFSPLVGAVFDMWSLGAALSVSAAWAGGALVMVLLLAWLQRRGDPPEEPIFSPPLATPSEPKDSLIPGELHDPVVGRRWNPLVPLQRTPSSSSLKRDPPA